MDREVLGEYDRHFYYKDSWQNSTDKNGVEKEQMHLLEDAVSIAYQSWVDELDCKDSYARKHTTLTLDDFLVEYKKSDFKIWRFVCFKDWNPEFSDKVDIAQVFIRIDVKYKELDRDENGEFYWLRRKDLFLWVNMPYKDGLELFEKYGLTKQ